MDHDIRYARELGSDDYLTKPIAADDLISAVRGRLLRARQLAAASRAPESASPDFIHLGSLTLQCGQYRVWLEGTERKLSAAEFRLLEELAQQAEQVVALQDLVKVTHGIEADYAEAGVLLRPMVRSIRRKLGYNTGDTGCVESVRGVGYRLLEPELHQQTEGALW
jgi:DNA-binding response OmpR family regulator